MSDYGECTVHLVGRVADISPPRPGANASVAAFRVVVEREGKPQLFRCIAWGGAGRYVQDFVEVGDLMYVIGPLESRVYEVDGEKQHSMEIKAIKLQKLGRSKTTRGH